MSQRTPGPWDFGKLGNDADQWSVFDEAGRDIGLSYHGEANAQLIAAAPEMLAALEKGQGEKWVHNAANTQDIEALRAICLEFSDWWNNEAAPAITKAKGETL